MDSRSTRRRAICAIAGTAVLGGCSSILDADSTVETRDGLVGALDGASEGDTVTVSPDAEIDLSGVWKTTIPAGVTLDGGGEDRGESGALLSAPSGDEGPADEKFHKKFKLKPGARFTGFRLRGHHHEYVNPETAFDGDFYAHRGGGVRAGDDAEVDNNEISGWPHAAVMAVGDAHIHHNSIHHNAWEGLGYGVAIPTGDYMPVIEDNDFNYNRHSITGGGGPDVGYIARNNVFGEEWVGAPVDMHGTEGMSGVAGERVVVERNTFLATRAVEEKTRNPGGEYPAIQIRGAPTDEIRVANNWFRHESRDGAYEQTDGPQDVTFENNHFGAETPDDPEVGAPRSRSGDSGS